jgi:hypothetical protein
MARSNFANGVHPLRAETGTYSLVANSLNASEPPKATLQLGQAKGSQFSLLGSQRHAIRGTSHKGSSEFTESMYVKHWKGPSMSRPTPYIIHPPSRLINFFG